MSGSRCGSVALVCSPVQLEQLVARRYNRHLVCSKALYKCRSLCANIGRVLRKQRNSFDAFLQPIDGIVFLCSQVVKQKAMLVAIRFACEFAAAKDGAITGIWIVECVALPECS